MTAATITKDAFTTLDSTYVVLPVDNVDTDQIIPARFLKVTDKKGLGDNVFADWRILPDGKPNVDFPLNRPDAKGARILVAGANFGCGSSSGPVPARRVAPKAATCATPQEMSLARSKTSASFGFDPGHPSSMYATPSASSRRAMRILSPADRLRPSRCVPSRRVVS